MFAKLELNEANQVKMYAFEQEFLETGTAAAAAGASSASSSPAKNAYAIPVGT